MFRLFQGFLKGVDSEDRDRRVFYHLFTHAAGREMVNPAAYFIAMAMGCHDYYIYLQVLNSLKDLVCRVSDNNVFIIRRTMAETFLTDFLKIFIALFAYPLLQFLKEYRICVSVYMVKLARVFDNIEQVHFCTVSLTER